MVAHSRAPTVREWVTQSIRAPTEGAGRVYIGTTASKPRRMSGRIGSVSAAKATVQRNDRALLEEGEPWLNAD